MDCPQGFIFPDDPASVDNIYINRTMSECALSCLNPPIFNGADYDKFTLTELTSSIVGAVMSFIVVYLWYRNKKRHKYFLTISYGVGIVCVLLLFSISSSFGRERNCRNNANAIEGSDGFTLCALEGAALLFALNTCSISFCFQSFIVFRRTILRSQHTLPWTTCILFTVGLPLLCSLVGLFSGAYSSNFSLGICRISQPRSAGDLMISVVPVAISVFFGMVFTTTIFVQIVVLAVSGPSVWDSVRLVGNSASFMVYSGVYLVLLLCLRLTILSVTEVDLEMEASLRWGECALAHFEGSVASYAAICGPSPAHDLSTSFICGIAFLIRGGFGVAFFLVNLEGVVTETRKQFFPSFIEPAPPYVELVPESRNTSDSPRSPNKGEEPIKLRVTESHSPAPEIAFHRGTSEFKQSEGYDELVLQIRREVDDYGVL